MLAQAELKMLAKREAEVSGRSNIGQILLDSRVRRQMHLENAVQRTTTSGNVVGGRRHKIYGKLGCTHSQGAGLIFDAHNLALCALPFVSSSGAYVGSIPSCYAASVDPLNTGAVHTQNRTVHFRRAPPS